jgi:hypothetical protein
LRERYGMNENFRTSGQVLASGLPTTHYPLSTDSAVPQAIPGLIQNVIAAKIWSVYLPREGWKGGTPSNWSALADDFRTFLLNSDIFELKLSAV